MRDNSAGLAEAYHDQDETSSGRDPPQPHLGGEGGLPDARDGVLLQVGRVGGEVRSRLLVLLSEAHTVPLVSQAGVLSLPILQECHS